MIGPMSTILMGALILGEPFNAWVLLKGLETMKLRVEAQSHAAHKVAAALEAMPGIARALYPHLASHPQATLCRKQMTLGGTMVTFEVEGGKKKAFDLLRTLGIFYHFSDGSRNRHFLS